MGHDHSHTHADLESESGVKYCDSTSDSKPMESFHNRELVLDEEILSKAKEIADLISKSSEVEIYKQAEVKIQSHERIQTLIKTIKRKQKEAVAFEHFKNPSKVQQIEAEIEELQQELDSFPLVQQFQQTQQDINYLLQLIINVVADRLSNQLQVLVGADSNLPPTNCSDET